MIINSSAVKPCYQKLVFEFPFPEIDSGIAPTEKVIENQIATSCVRCFGYGISKVLIPRWLIWPQMQYVFEQVKKEEVWVKIPAQEDPAYMMFQIISIIKKFRKTRIAFIVEWTDHIRDFMAQFKRLYGEKRPKILLDTTSMPAKTLAFTMRAAWFDYIVAEGKAACVDGFLSPLEGAERIKKAGNFIVATTDYRALNRGKVDFIIVQGIHEDNT